MVYHEFNISLRLLSFQVDLYRTTFYLLTAFASFSQMACIRFGYLRFLGTVSISPAQQV